RTRHRRRHAAGLRVRDRGDRGRVAIYPPPTGELEPSPASCPGGPHRRTRRAADVSVAALDRPGQRRWPVRRADDHSLARLDVSLIRVLQERELAGGISRPGHWLRPGRPPAGGHAARIAGAGPAVSRPPRPPLRPAPGGPPESCLRRG